MGGAARDARKGPGGMSMRSRFREIWVSKPPPTAGVVGEHVGWMMETTVGEEGSGSGSSIAISVFKVMMNSSDGSALTLRDSMACATASTWELALC